MTAGAESRTIEFKGRCLLALSAVDALTIQVSIPKNKLGLREEPAFYLRLDREGQTLADCPPPEPKEESVGPSARQRAKRQSDEAAREATRQRNERERLEKEAQKAERDADDDRMAKAVRAEMPGIGYTELKRQQSWPGDGAARRGLSLPSPGRVHLPTR